MCRTRVANKSGETDINSEDECSGGYGELGLQKYTLDSAVPFPFRGIVPSYIFQKYLVLGVAHVLGVYGMYLALAGYCPDPVRGAVYLIAYGYLGGLGVTAGAHRLWTHRAYKANKPLQIFLMLCQTSAWQNTLIKWCRDHRIHHKYTDTNADPHSSARGFWFSHMGWLLQKEHPDVLKMEKKIPMSDLENDPILRFQAEYYWPLVFLTVFVIPCTFLYIYFPQPLFQIICVNYSRWIVQTQFSMLINSAAHYFGDKPFDKTISSVDNKLLAMFTIGEAWHNYHHVFPYDYKASELPVYPFNMTTAFIEFCAWMGWATELKTVPKEMVLERVKRTGDGTHSSHHHHHNHHHEEISHSYEDAVVDDEEREEEVILPTQIDGKIAAWGWGDVDMKLEAEEVSRFLNVDSGRDR